MVLPTPSSVPSAAMAALLIALLAPSAGHAQEAGPDAAREAYPAAPAVIAEIGDAPLAYHLAREARARGELERAAALLEIAVDLDPDAVLPRLDRVEVLLALNRPARISGILAPIAAAMETDASPTTAARYHRLRGAVALRTGNPGLAIERYERAVDLAPWDLGLRAQLIGLHRASGDLAGAIPHLEAASRVLPFNAELKAQLGDALLDLQRYSEAETAYREALELAPAASKLRETIERKIDRVRSATDR